MEETNNIHVTGSLSRIYLLEWIHLVVIVDELCLYFVISLSRISPKSYRFCKIFGSDLGGFYCILIFLSFNEIENKCFSSYSS